LIRHNALPLRYGTSQGDGALRRPEGRLMKMHAAVIRRNQKQSAAAAAAAEGTVSERWFHTSPGTATERTFRAARA